MLNTLFNSENYERTVFFNPLWWWSEFEFLPLELLIKRESTLVVTGWTPLYTNFKPPYIASVKEVWGHVEVSLMYTIFL